MKQFFIILATVLVFGTLTAQPEATIQNPNKEKGETVVTWLNVDTAVGPYGGASPVEAYMEFTQDDLFNFNGEKIDAIKRVQFFIAKSFNLSLISSVNVILAQGQDFKSKKIMVSQSVPLSEITNEWNDVLLDSVYEIDLSQKLFIGYQVILPSSGYPIAYTYGENTKQAWFTTGTLSGNLVVSGIKRVFLIKATAETSLPLDVEIELNSVELPYQVLIQDKANIKGTVKNMGETPITSFKYKYEVNGVSSTEELVTGINLAPKETYTFVHPTQYTFTTAELTKVKVSITEPNGVTDYLKNNEIEYKTLVYAELLSRKVLHEVYTSSSCPPCTLGTSVLKNIFTSVDTAKWVCIKYQMQAPLTGDPYYTIEARDRGNTNDVGAIPHLRVDGATGLITYDYTVNGLNTAATVPAAFRTSGVATIDPDAKNVSFEAKLTPVFTANNDLNLGFFAAIVEKRTERNASTNGETSFTYVMKKFMTNPITGDAFTNVVEGEEISLNYDYTFNGNYRLPDNAGSPINHDYEHSVEDFNHLMVVYWVQDLESKMVLQAGAADPDPSFNPNIGISQLKANFKLNVYPNPAANVLYVQTDAALMKVSLFNLLGQTIKEVEGNNAFESQINVNNLSPGMYLLKVDTQEGTITRKVEVRPN